MTNERLDEFISMTKEAIRKVLPDLFRNVLEDYTANVGDDE